jgi:hypothetical protein
VVKVHQTRGQPLKGTRPTLVFPHWVRGLALGVGAAILLSFARYDLAGFSRAAALLALYVLVLATVADVIWHVWTWRKPAPVAALSGSTETVPYYAIPVRMWVTAGAVALAAAATILHGSAAMGVLRAWAHLHRWAPPEITLRAIPSVVPAHQPFHLTVLVDKDVASGYRCEWHGLVAEWSSETSCEVEYTAPARFVAPDWPSRRVPVSARVFDGDRLLGTTPRETITINYAPMIELIADKSRIIQGQKAQYTVRVDGHPPGPDDKCRWSVEGEFVSSERCTFAYSAKELAASPSASVRVAVEVENLSNHTVGKATAALTVDQPQRYMVYVVETSRRMAQQSSTGPLLEELKTDLVDGLSNADLSRSYLGIATFGGDASRPPCFQNIQVPYPLQPLRLNEAKSVLYVLQPGAADAPFASAMIKGLGLFQPHASRAGEHASFAFVSVAAGLDTCAGPKPEDSLAPLAAVMEAVRSTTASLNGRLLAMTIGIGFSEQDRRQWESLARYTPTQSPYVIIPAPNVVTLDLAVRAAVQLGSRDYDTRLAGCGDLVRILRTRNLDSGAAHVERYCRTLAAP